MARVHVKRAGMAFAGVLLVAAFAEQATAQIGVAGTFDRSYTVSGRPELDVRTNSGGVTIRTGGSDRIQIHGEIRVGSRWFGGGTSDADIRDLEQHPPITQSGNVVRIDRLGDEDRWRSVSISYEIVVPDGTQVRASSGSGGVRVTGVSSVRATTGSGSIRLTGVKGDVDAHTGSGGIDAEDVTGAFRAETGSGSIDATLRNAGPVEVSTGSGSIRVVGVKGGLNARTGSGSITVDGSPTADWYVQSSSGGVTVTVPSDARFDLHARTGSGRITSDHPVTVRTTERRSLEGQVRGGGPRMELRTSSGSIRIR
jgi:putative adhesin